MKDLNPEATDNREKCADSRARRELPLAQSLVGLHAWKSICKYTSLVITVNNIMSKVMYCSSYGMGVLFTGIPIYLVRTVLSIEEPSY